jgi:hypothetical protein
LVRRCRLSRIPLRPVASPVDTFAPSEVRRGDGGAAGLAQLADALGSFNPALQGFSETYTYAQRAEAETEARALQAQRQYKSLTDLKGAVDRGEIKEDDNPWKMVFLKQLVGRNEVRLAAQSIEQEYESSPIRYKDNPAEVEAFVQERLATLAQGRDNWELASVSAAADEFRNEFVAGHIKRRAHERDLETQVGFTRQVSQDAAEAIAMINDGASPDAVIARTQQAVNAAGMVVHPEKLRAWATQSVIQAAVAARDPDSVTQLMQSIKVGDKTLAETMPVGAMEQLQEEIQQKRVRDIQVEALLEDQAQKQQTKNGLAAFDSYVRSERAAGREPSLTEMNLVIDQMDVSPEIRQKLKAMGNDMSREAVSLELSRFMGLVSSGTATEADRTNFLRFNLAHLANGRDAVFTAKQLEAAIETDEWGETDGLAASSIVQMLHSTASTQEKFQMLEGLRTARRIDLPLYLNTMERVMRSELQDGEKRAQMTRFVDDIQSRLSLAYMNDPASTVVTMDSMGGDRVSLTPEAEARIGAAARELDDAYWRFVTDPANANANYDQLVTMLSQRSEEIIKRNGGLTPEQFQDRVTFGTIEKQLSNGDVDDLSQYLLWEEGKLMVRVGDKTKEAPKSLKLFGNQNDFVARREAVMDELRIESPADRDRFMMDQASVFGHEALIEVRETLLARDNPAETMVARAARLQEARSAYERDQKSWEQWMQLFNTMGPGATHYYVNGEGWVPLPTLEELKSWQKQLINHRRTIRELEEGKSLTTQKEPDAD